jgi:hypothetical protein
VEGGEPVSDAAAERDDSLPFVDAERLLPGGHRVLATTGSLEHFRGVAECVAFQLRDFLVPEARITT